MKNTAIDLYSIDPAASYQHGFGYIRQLAVNLRNTLKAKPASSKAGSIVVLSLVLILMQENGKEGKEKSKSNQEPYKQVYNWQFVHCIDFWSMLLSRNCAPADGREESELQPLIYPLVQVALGGVKYDHRFHLVAIPDLFVDWSQPHDTTHCICTFSARCKCSRIARVHTSHWRPTLSPSSPP